MILASKMLALQGFHNFPISNLDRQQLIKRESEFRFRRPGPNSNVIRVFLSSSVLKIFEKFSLCPDKK